MSNNKLQQTAVKIIHFSNKTEIQQTNNSQEISHTIRKMKTTSIKINNNILKNPRNNNWNINDQPDNVFQPDIFEPHMHSEQLRQIKQFFAEKQNLES